MSSNQNNLQKNSARKTLAKFGVYGCVMRQGLRRFNALTHHILGTVFKLAVLAYFIFCALFLSVRYGVLPRIDYYKTDVEKMASHVIGNKVSIGTIRASWEGLRPHLALGNVVIHDKFGNQALVLPSVAATLSWWSVVVADVRLHQLEITRPDMDVLRDAHDNFYVAGIFIDTHNPGSGKGADWVLSQREIVIRDGRVRWNDYKRAAPELVLDNVDFVLRNQWRDHRMALKATPPAAFSAPLDIRAAFKHPRFTHRISDPSLWRGQIYADLQNTDLTVWKAYVDYPIDIRQGKGSVRAWLNFDHARVADFTADLTLSNVSARLRDDLDLLNLAQVNGRVAVQEAFNPNIQDGKPTFGVNGHSIALSDFSLQTEDGLVLPKTTISEHFVPAKNGKPEKTEIVAKSLDLHTLANFVERLPVPAAQRQILADFAPRGTLKDFSVQWQGVYPNISAYHIKGHFVGLSLKAQAPRPAHPKTGKTPAQAAVPGIPGFENLTGQVEASDQGGSFSLDSQQLRLQLPGYFANPDMVWDQMKMRANWTFQENDLLLLEIKKMDFAREKLTGSFSGKHLLSLNQSPGNPQGVIDVSGKLNGLDLEKIDQYLPIQTPEDLRDWLSNALVGGMAQDLKLRVKGNLADFPFHGRKAGDKAKGEFSIAGRIENGRLNYTPGTYGKNGVAPLWPLLEDIQGTILFDRTRMEIHASSAKTSSVALSNIKASISDLSAPDMMLAIEGDGTGALQDFIRFVNDSPVGEWIADFTEETKTSGPARLALKLQLPLTHLMDAKVQGSLQFAGNNITLQNIIPPLAATQGKLEFHEKGFQLQGIKANFLGGPVVLSGGTQKDGTILVKADGSVTADGIRKIYATPAVQGLSDRITGSTRFSTSIRVKNKRPEILVESSLTGIALNFPVPLRKGAHESLPLKFELTAIPSSDASLMRDEMKLSLGSAIVARYERQKSTEKEADWQVMRGGIGVNMPAPQPDQGLIANVSLKSLDIDAWRRVMQPVKPADQLKEVRKPVGSSSPIAQYIEPEVLAARASELIILGKKLDNVIVGASYQKGVWQANIDSEQASGYVSWHQSQAGQELGKVTARLASLIIPKSAASDVTELLEGKNASTHMPAVDIIAENFELFGKKFGHVELVASDARATLPREWRIHKLSISNNDAELKASGKWTAEGVDSASRLAYTLTVHNAGGLLERFGFANVMRGGKGQLAGEIGWKGLPFSIDMPSLYGQVQMDIAAGQFLKVESGAAKLLGVLNLQSLPRRLALDFRDVFSEGFAFDSVVATATIAQGVAKTNNFKMRSVATTVLIDGTADIVKESQNLQVVVIPEINAGAASVVYALAVNPVIGVGTFLAQLFLRDPLMKAFTFEYQITGPWKDPVVTKVLRNKPADATGKSSDFAEIGG